MIAKRDKTKNNKPIFKLSLAKYLTERGFEIVDIKINKKNPSKLIFFFNVTNELEQALNEYFKINE